DEVCADIIEAIMDRAVELKEESLLQLDLSKNTIRVADISGLSTLLRSTTKVEEVTLAGNAFSGSEVQKLYDALEANKAHPKTVLKGIDLPLPKKIKKADGETTMPTEIGLAPDASELEKNLHKSQRLLSV